MKKMLLFTMFLFTYGCSQQTIEPAPLPENEFLVIAHRGASAYAAAHTLAAYNLAVQMDTDYIEIDLQMTKDGKLVALHDTLVSLNGSQKNVADITLNEIQRDSLEKEQGKIQPVFATANIDDLRIVDLAEILQNYGDTVNYYIELKSPDAYPGIEKELLKLLRENQLLNKKNSIPKVVIQSFDDDCLKKIFAIEPSIPLIKLYKFDKEANISKNELKKLTQYASGVGVNVEALTRDFIVSTQISGLHVHAYTVNDEEIMRNLLELGVNGFFTDRPDVGIRVKNEKDSRDID